ncbi:MAG: chromate transporter [Oscillospiraceae bacterium]|nr:chromate transporter [Oscillospiraceae bacterium]
MFLNFFKVGLFTFGGGYSAMPLIKEYIAEQNGWLTLQELSDIIVISEMTPGPIAVNVAAFTGMRLLGFGGAVICTLGCIMPSVVICLVLALIYKKFKGMKALDGFMWGLRPCVIALIAAAAASIFLPALALSGFLPKSDVRLDVFPLILFSLSIFVIIKWKVKPVYIMLAAGAAGAGFYWLMPLLIHNA